MATYKNNNSGLEISSRIKQELMELENEQVEANGVLLKPSQCYHFETDPPHVLFNTNCPSTLKEKIQSILSKYINRT